MPEGDTIHKLAAGMRPHLVGRAIESLRLRDRGEVPALRGVQVVGIEVFGKHMVIRFEGERNLRVHLGIQGRWRSYARARMPARPDGALELPGGGSLVRPIGARPGPSAGSGSMGGPAAPVPSAVPSSR